MYKFMFRQWKNRKATVLLILIGFMIGSFVMSLGISACKESFAYISDQTRGKQEQQLDIFLACDNAWKQEVVEEIVEGLSGYGEVQLLSMGNQKLEQFEESCAIVPVLFQKEPDWHVPLLEGRYFSVDEMNRPQKTIVLGKHLATKYDVRLGDTVDIAGQGFRVIGICGRSSRETSREYAIFMCWADYLAVYQNCFQDFKKDQSIAIHLEQGKRHFMENAEEFVREASQKGIRVEYSQADEADTSSLRNTLTLTIVSTILIFTIAVINIVHLMLYWLMERKREIGIMKALGANNGAIIRSVLLEVLALSCLGCLSAILIQYLVMHLVTSFQSGMLAIFRVTWQNLVYAMGVSLFFGVISAIVPAWTAVRFEPVSVISNE